MTQPPLPQPQLDRQPITFDQYEAYTPEKLELWDGFYEYGGEDFTGFYLAVFEYNQLSTWPRQNLLSDSI
ncbi:MULTISPECIES: hypothetical protein [Spirulina sp. CCY15215]|uniref:hypothetical protein n=1 Tax=Spirulina sp. CCY15215 TaxID=2767591 RepID=UPI00194E30C3|nr:hypothetical protein [Spirulina major]